MIKSIFTLFITLVFAFSPLSLSAADKYRVVLQISDDSLDKQTLVLNVADNLYSSFGEALELEIVAFGPGLNLMLSGNRQAQRLKSLSEHGVKLTACRTTATKMAKLTGQEIRLLPNVRYADGGAAHIVVLVKKGYVLLRP